MAPQPANRNPCARRTLALCALALLPTALASLGAAALPMGAATDLAGVPDVPGLPVDPIPRAWGVVGEPVSFSCDVVGPQTSSLNTGTTGAFYYSDVTNPPGTTESKWHLTSAPTNIPPLTTAYRVNDRPGWMSTSGYPAKWISAGQQGGNAVPAPTGTYEYELQVNVRCPFDFYLNFCYAADDQVEFRFGLVGSPQSFGQLYPSGQCYNSIAQQNYGPGLRSLRAIVHNAAGPTGLWVFGYAYGT